MKNLICFTAGLSSSCTLPTLHTQLDQNDYIILRKTIDIVLYKPPYPKYVFIGEQVLVNLDHYLAVWSEVDKRDSLSILM